MGDKNPILAQERRYYVRLDSVFPVQFQLVSLDGATILSDWTQGFTNNIGKGGICLEINNLKKELAELISARQAKVALAIEMPLGRNPVKAHSTVAWVQAVADQPSRYLVGLRYESIDTQQNARILRYALAKKFFAPLALVLLFLFGLGLTLNAYVNFKLIKGNRVLVEQLVGILQDSSIARQKIKQISREKEEFQLKLQTLEQHLKSLEEEKSKKKEEANKIGQLNTMIDKLTQEKAALQEQLIGLQHKESLVTNELLDIEKKKASIEKANFDKMYQWIKIHQNQQTGLVMSFEGDSDIANWAFIYDQALAAQAYTYFGDFDRARRILSFFEKRAKRSNGRFFNAYYANEGSPAEYIVHSGPNIWLGIAILQYTKKTNDRTYLKLAEEIAAAIVALQNEDKEGGIRGGPDVAWYSTEHNLDAYAFFHMLTQLTGKDQYVQAQDKVLQWLVSHTYDRSEIPIKRGKGDATIATDTYAWAIAAIGPQRLQEREMNPDRIMEFAEQSCAVEVSYTRPEGQTIKVKGFDFASQRNLARGGVVSCEWTAQMVLSFKIMADFYYKKDMAAKSRFYETKAEEYLGNLGQMIISSPSPSGQGESCLPYATQDFVDTGHGWMTPKGNCTGSVASTAYTLFAYYNYNPLELK